MACRKKYKALILKYVPCISKYMACIFRHSKYLINNDLQKRPKKGVKDWKSDGCEKSYSGA